MIRPLGDLVKAHVLEALRICDGNKGKAAAALGISRQGLIMMLRRWHVAEKWMDLVTCPRCGRRVGRNWNGDPAPHTNPARPAEPMGCFRTALRRSGKARI